MTERAAVTPIVRCDAGTTRTDQDLVAVEAPLSVVVTHRDLARPHPFGIVMRTPGHDRELVTGLLFAEGVIQSRADVASVVISGTTEAGETVTVDLAADAPLDSLASRAQGMTSACGLCGRLEMLRAERRRARPAGHAPQLFRASVIAAAPETLRTQQSVFAETGGLHAAGSIDASGALLAIHEDVGRHNAVDKLVGTCLLGNRLPATDQILVVSGRVAFEIVQKAVAAGFDVIVSVGAPSSLAIDAAGAAG